MYVLLLQVRYVALVANSPLDHIQKMHERKEHSSYWLNEEQKNKQREVMELKLQDLIQDSEMMRDFVTT